MSNHERFHVVYDGSALIAHQMDVRDLAPALLAFADLLTAANKEMNGDAVEVRVQVNANFKIGSFGIELIATQQLLSQIKDLFSGSGASAICNAYAIMSMVGLTGGGLIGMLRKLKGRQPVKIEQTNDVSKVWVTETESFEVNHNLMRLYRNIAVRTSLEKIMSPLERDGISDFGVLMNEEVVLDIHDDEVASFSAAGSYADCEIVSDVTSRKMLVIESLTFKNGNKWRLDGGGGAVHVSIEDEAFLANVDAGERFGKGDVLIVDLREIQTVIGGRLRNDLRIVKVLEHRKPLQEALV
jgi:hypothetical protein